VVKGANPILKISVLKPLEEGTAQTGRSPLPRPVPETQPPVAPDKVPLPPATVKTPDKAGHPSTPDVDSEVARQVARWALENQGMVSSWIPSASTGGWLKGINEIPEEDFVVQNLSMRPGMKVSSADMQRISRLQSLIAFRMEKSNLDDEGLKLVADNRKLMEIAINDCAGITDQGLSPLKDLKSLVHLRINGTQLTDEGLKSLAGLSELQTLQVAGTKLTDQAVESILRFSKLEQLDLNGTQVTDAAVKRLRTLPKLQLLYLNRTQVTDAALEALAGHPTLRLISVSGTRVTDEGLAYLPEIPELVSVVLEDCQVTDAGLGTHVARLEKLNVLMVSGTGLTDKGLDALQVLPEITNLSLANTDVSHEGIARFRKAHPKIYITGAPASPN
jgi:Leucine-rich repeat (LRR) protein